MAWMLVPEYFWYYWSPGIFHTQQFLEFKRKVAKVVLITEVRGKWPFFSLSVVTQTTTLYNHCEQKGISEHTTCWTLRLMDNGSRRSHWVPLLQQVTSGYLNWTFEKRGLFPVFSSLRVCFGNTGYEAHARWTWYQAISHTQTLSHTDGQFCIVSPPYWHGFIR